MLVQPGINLYRQRQLSNYFASEKELEYFNGKFSYGQDVSDGPAMDRGFGAGLDGRNGGWAGAAAAGS